MYLKLGLIFIAFLLPFSCKATSATVYYTGGKYSYKEGVYDENGAARAQYQDTLDTVGWGRLVVQTNKNFDDKVQAHAAGLLEGALTHTRMFQHRHNILDWFLHHYVRGGIWPAALWSFLDTNLEYTKEKIKNNPTDDYWIVTSLVVSQFEGLTEGYQLMAPAQEQLTELDLWMYNTAGDLLDLATAVSPELRPNFDEMTHDEIMTYTLLRDHCTGFVRLTEGYKDIFFGQDAWFTFGSMNRVFKHYDFNYQNDIIKAPSMTFSSYPGFLFSFDDHYTLSSGLCTLETTNEIFNTTLYDLVVPQCVLEWVRVRIANYMADSGEQWASVFERENSGTYNNQWLILDYKKFTPGTKPSPGTLWALEQIPGFVQKADITDHFVEQGYMPSYNIPYFKDIFNISGYPSDKTWWSYEDCPRAKILRRNASSVNTLEEMKNLMRYNNWEHDPLSKKNPGNAPASRYDLNAKGESRGTAFGALDSKVTSYELAKNLIVEAISSPTYVQQPIFKFSTNYSVLEHVGLPDEYHFPWVKWDFNSQTGELNDHILDYDD
ncbi:phospholipase b-related [Anaeramoeba flamelloides]|uniref:Phospholipase B-like n=1 Tax=Anaeramoeba flamelloides TaxID=1746091 RepID=A0ABQ8Y9R5_9EUKA|nr:phospholipase b-related [Anaeramoeba flamelloides]